MKLIEERSARIVCLSRRRAWIFKKASELYVLCGAQISLIIFTLCGRAYTFGHPDVESFVRRFLNHIPIPDLQERAKRFNSTTHAQLMEQCDEKAKELEVMKRKAKEHEEVLESSVQITDEQLDHMFMNQLQDLKVKLEKLRVDIMASIQLGSAGTWLSRNVAKPSPWRNVDIPSVPNDVDQKKGRVLV